MGRYVLFCFVIAHLAFAAHALLKGRGNWVYACCIPFIGPLLYVMEVIKPGGSRAVSGGRSGSSGSEKQLYAELVRRAMGDRSLANRLIALERDRKPNESRREHVAAALRRWELDNT